jgi:hypothetical protein
MKKPPKIKPRQTDRAVYEHLYDDPVICRNLIRAFGRGLPLHLAAAIAGLAPATVAKWFVEGAGDLERNAATPLAALVSHARRAEAKHADLAIGRVTRAGKYEWRAAGWLLERRHGFASKTVVEAKLGGDDEGIKLDVNLSGLSTAELRALAYAPGEDGDPDEDLS